MADVKRKVVVEITKQKCPNTKIWIFKILSEMGKFESIKLILKMI